MLLPRFPTQEYCRLRLSTAKLLVGERLANRSDRTNPIKRQSSRKGMRWPLGAGYAKLSV